MCLIIEQPNAETASISIRTHTRSALTLDAEVENVEVSTPLPITAVFDGEETRTLVRLKRSQRRQAWKSKNVRYLEKDKVYSDSR